MAEIDRSRNAMRERLDFSDIPRQPGAFRYSGARLNLYQRLIQYFGIVTEAGGEYLDLINFNRGIFPEVISLSESELLFRPEHGYSCPDGSAEVADLVRRFETARARRFLGGQRVVAGSVPKGMAVGIGAGATGVMNCLVPAIRDFFAYHDTHRGRRMVVTLPQYSVYDGIIAEHGVEPEYVYAQRANKFLPILEDLKDAIAARPMAVILTYPTNPAQTTYEGSLAVELAKILRLCMDNEVFAIVDNVYQDTLWDRAAINPEVLALAGPKWMVKVFSASKDRPGQSGLRIGYWCGDPRLQEGFFYYSSIQYNTPNSASRCLLGLDLLFRTLAIEQKTIELRDLDVLGDYIAGWSRRLDRPALFENLCASGLQARYHERLNLVETRQCTANRILAGIARELPAFAEVVNGGIGNVLLLRVDPDVFNGTDHELFLKLLHEERIGILPANAFGFSIESKNAWFRVTTVHEPIDVIAGRLRRVSEALFRWSPHSW